MISKTLVSIAGGRAAGDGGTQVNQLFFFAANTDLGQPIPFILKADNRNNGVGDGNQCLTNNGNAIVAAPCSPPNFSPQQLFKVGGGAANPPAAQPPAPGQQPPNGNNNNTGPPDLAFPQRGQNPRVTKPVRTQPAPTQSPTVSSFWPVVA
jgi:hypothetical protein